MDKGASGRGGPKFLSSTLDLSSIKKIKQCQESLLTLMSLSLRTRNAAGSVISVLVMSELMLLAALLKLAEALLSHLGLTSFN